MKSLYLDVFEVSCLFWGVLFLVRNKLLKLVHAFLLDMLNTLRTHFLVVFINAEAFVLKLLKNLEDSSV